MSDKSSSAHRRILVIDRDQAIQDQIGRILDTVSPGMPKFQVESALQAREGLELAVRARQEGQPYSLVFIEVRMLQGGNEAEIPRRLWEDDPDLQLIFCAVESDGALEESLLAPGSTDQFLIVKKPFDSLGVRQMVLALTEKWRLAQETRRCRNAMEELVREREQAEAALARQSNLFGALMDNIPDNVYFKDRESRFTGISQALAKRVGLQDPSDAVGKTDFDFFTVEHAQPAFDDEQQIIRTGQPIVNKEERETHPDGRVRWVSTTKEPLRNPQGAIIGTFGVSRDITERKEVEQALRDSEARLRKVAETNEEMFRQMTEIIGQVFWLADPSVSRMIYVSPAYEEILGCRRERLYQSAESWLEAIHPEDRERVISSLPQQITKPIAVEYRILRPDGSVRWIADRRLPVRDQSGMIYQVAGVAEDITERKRAEEELSEERNLLHTLIETLPDQIYVKDTQSRFVIANMAHIRASGARSMKDLKGKTSFDFVSRELATRYIADDRHVMETRQPLLNVEAPTVFLDGRAGWILGSKVPLCDSQGKVIGLVGIARDITEPKLAEEALARERNLLRTLIETIPDRIYAKDTEARFILNNIAHLHALGARSQAEATGKTDFDFRPAQLATRSMADDRQVLQTGLPLNNREEATIFANGETGWLLATKVPLRDPQDKIVGLVGISRDITDRKRAETMMENLHKQLLDTSRQAGMAEVATNVLHNVGNVLNSMNVSLALVSDQVRKSRIANLAKATGLLQEHQTDLAAYLLGDPKGSQLPGYLIQLASHLTGEQAEILKELQSLYGNLEHIKEIVAMQQNYSKIAGVVETLPVVELIEDALRMNTAALARHEVQIVREYSEVPPVVVERHKVLQILVNLIRNAKYALDEGRKTDRRLTLRVTRNGDNSMQVSVIDNGIGLTPENLTRIFEHGFTTRKDGHGFGLHSGALAAKELGGTLSVHSEGVGKGATFTLALPTQPRTEGS